MGCREMVGRKRAGTRPSPPGILVSLYVAPSASIFSCLRQRDWTGGLSASSSLEGFRGSFLGEEAGTEDCDYPAPVQPPLFMGNPDYMVLPSVESGHGRAGWLVISLQLIFKSHTTGQEPPGVQMDAN